MFSSSFKCDQFYIHQSFDFGHTFVQLKSDLDVQQTHLRGHFIKQISCLAPALGVTNGRAHFTKHKQLFEY